MKYLIGELDRHRPPYRVTKSIFTPIHKGKYDSFIKENLRVNKPELKEEFDSYVKKFLENHEKEKFAKGKLVKEFIFGIILIPGTLFLLFLGLVILMNIAGSTIKSALGFWPSYFLMLILGLIIAISVITRGWIWREERLGNKIGGEMEEETIKFTQKVIDYMAEYLKKNKINPNSYKIKVNHRDYDGLSYENAEDGKFIATIDEG